MGQIPLPLAPGRWYLFARGIKSTLRGSLTMTIQFNCVCGRKLRAPGEATGRRGRCPACGHLFTVPGAIAPAPVEDDLPPLADAEPEPVPVAAGAASLTSEEDEFGEIPLAEPPPPSPISTRRAAVRVAPLA